MSSHRILSGLLLAALALPGSQAWAVVQPWSEVDNNTSNTCSVFITDTLWTSGNLLIDSMDHKEHQILKNKKSVPATLKPNSKYLMAVDTTLASYAITFAVGIPGGASTEFNIATGSGSARTAGGDVIKIKPSSGSLEDINITLNMFAWESTGKGPFMIVK